MTLNYLGNVEFMRHQYRNAVKNKVTKRRCGNKGRLEFRNESSLISRIYNIFRCVNKGSILNIEIVYELPLTNTHLSGNLVIDNMCRRISWQDSIKAYSERFEDAKQCTPNGAGKLPEVGKINDSRQFAWIFFGL